MASVKFPSQLSKEVSVEEFVTRIESLVKERESAAATSNSQAWEQYATKKPDSNPPGGE